MAIGIGSHAHEIESAGFEGLLPLGHEAEIVDPELTTDGTARRQAADVQDEKSGIGSGGEFSRRRLPEPGLFQFVAVIHDCLSVVILNCKMRGTGALHFSDLVVCGEFVASVRLNRDELTNPCVAYPRSIKGNEQGTMSTVKIGGIQVQGNALLLLVLPVE